MEEQAKVTPFENIVESLWNSPAAMTRGKEHYRQFMFGLALMHGVIDSLIPGVTVWKHNDPECPGDIRVRLATDGIVVMRYYFRQAPDVVFEIAVPIAEYKTGMETTVDSRMVIGKLVQMLLQAGSEQVKAVQPKKQELKLAVSEGS